MTEVLERRLKIVIISDGTGETASAMVRAAMKQFEDRDVMFTRYKNIRNREQLDSIFTEAAINHDMIAYTIVQKDLRLYIAELSKTKHVPVVDLMGDLLTALSNYFIAEPKSMPGLLHAVNDQYFKRVAAIEFTINHDDGQNLQSLHLADVILVGISRTSKTPLSMYLSLNGLKVVNIPLVPGSNLSEELFKVDQRKIFGLTISSDSLWEIRKNRLKGLGVNTQHGDYADKSKVLDEIEWAQKIFRQNKRWPVLDVTGKAVEETASEIMRLLNMRKNNQFKQTKRFSDSEEKEEGPKD